MYAGMEATASAFQHNCGPGLHGAPPAQGPRQPSHGPYGAAQPEQQPPQHHKPFFYIHPSHQPYLPLQGGLQWPMPVPYNPYCGYPGLGYGMPMMPHYQPGPYMEPMSYVLPQTQLHLMDYRRVLSPQYYQTMAYHTRRMRYQHSGPAKDVTCSEVQTEPLMTAQRCSSPVPSDGGASSVSLPVCGKDGQEKNRSGSSAQPPPAASAVKTSERSSELQDLGSAHPARALPQSSYVIQTEEVRIECCSMPMGLEVMRSHETAALSHGFPRDVARCSSVQEERMCLAAEQSEQCLQVCPDILLVGTPSCSNGENLPSCEDPQTGAVSVALETGSGAAVCGEALVTGYNQDQVLNQTPNSMSFKVLQLPSDLKHPDELTKTPESAAWSLDATCVPATDLLIQNDAMDPQDETLALPSDMSSINEVMARDEDMEVAAPAAEMPLFVEDLIAEVVPTAEDPVVKLVPGAEVHHTKGAAVVDFRSELSCIAEVCSTTGSPLVDKSPVSADRRELRSPSVDQETSFESLPAYLSSTSRLADFVYHNSKLPQTPQKPITSVSGHPPDVPIRRRKLDLAYEELDVAKLRGEKCKVYRPSLSDHECHPDQHFHENAHHIHARGLRLCAKCLAKRAIHISSSPGLDGQRPWADVLLATCKACKSYSKKRAAVNGSSLDIASLCKDDTEDFSENSCGRMGTKRRSCVGPRRPADPKRPLTPIPLSGKSPVVKNPKLREKNCACEERPPATWAQHAYVGDIREVNDENFSMPAPLQDKWRNTDQRWVAQKSQTEKVWKAGLPNSGKEGCKNGARSQHLSKRRRT